MSEDQRALDKVARSSVSEVEYVGRAGEAATVEVGA